MILRLLSVFFIFASVTLAEENPFFTKFGGPYTSADLSYRRSAASYGSMWMKAFAVLGESGLKNKEGFNGFCRDAVDPELAKLSPKTEEEKKIKEAAIYIRTIFASIADPDSVGSEDKKKIEQFITSATPPDKEQTLASHLTYTLIRFQEFIVGMTTEEMQKKQKS